MEPIVYLSKGGFKATETFLAKLLRRNTESILRKYGALGVTYLSEATPKDTGLTATSWSYEVVREGQDYQLIWNNSNSPRGVPVAILIQYGHGYPNGTWKEGIDYINPALKPIFEGLVDELWKEVTS